MHRDRNNSGIAPLLIVVGIALLSLIGAVAVKNVPQLQKSSAAPVYQDKTTELTPIADSYVTKSSAGSNFGSRNQLFSGGTGAAVSYLKFDTSSVKDKELSGIKMQLNVEDVSSGQQTLSFVVDTAWAEGSVKWNNKPSLTQSIKTFSANSKGVTTIDLTSLAQGSKLPFAAISVGVSSSSRDLAIYTSKEGSVSPKLIVTYKELVESTPQPTSSDSPTTPPSTKPTNTDAPHTGGGSTGFQGIDPKDAAVGNAMAFGVWHPWVSKVTGKVVDTCSEAIHNSYYVVGPDGLRYPTWHPAVDPSTGCTFGHEHGFEPAKFADWARVKKLYAYDGVDGCPKDGVISSCEINAKHTGVPFGYVNEVYSAYSQANNLSSMRHEDHYGHKVKFMNNEAIDQGNVAGAGGVLDRYDTGVRCNFFGKIHMGVTTKDAFSNNIHEVIEYMHCTDGVEYSVAKLGKFGAAGEFLASCTGTQFENRNNCGPNVIKTGITSTNAAYPGTCSDGNRSILTRRCLEELMFVPGDKFSGNLYESWNTVTGLRNANGTSLVSTDMTIDVNDSIRNYDTSKPDNVGYNVDICDDKSPVAGRTIRGGFCDRITNYHKNPVPSWDDPKALTGTDRGMYFSHVWSINNAGKSAYKLTDPFGENATDTTENGVVPAGYIKQYVSSINFDWAKTYRGTLMPNNTNIQHDTGNGTVHAPN